MIVRSFRKRNSFQKNANTVYFEYSYSGIVPKERARTLFTQQDKYPVFYLDYMYKLNFLNLNKNAQQKLIMRARDL